MKTAIVHDWLYGGGAEKVVQQLHSIYPDAPIYTSYCTEEWQTKLDGKVITGYLNRWPFTVVRKFLPLLRMWWFSSLDLSDYDLVISSSGNGEARFASFGTKTRLHISYTHTPTHFYWRKYDAYIANPGFKPAWLVRFGLKVLVGYMRKKDFEAAQKIDYLIANSSHIQADIKQYYERDSVVIHPPVDTSRFRIGTKNEKRRTKNSPLRLVAWGRLVPYKRFDLIVAVCSKLGLELDVIGDGPELEKLKAIAGPTVKLLGRVSDKELEEAASRADAFLFPSEEDFGIAPVEAMAAGLPVIAYKSGGAMDYVVEGKTGIFFDEQTEESLTEAIKRFNPTKFDFHEIAQHAYVNFDNKIFHQKITEFVDRVLVESKSKDWGISLNQ